MYSIFIWHVRQYGYRAELCVQACLQSPIVTWPAGLSLGEYCALVFAGVLSFEDGLKVVKARGESMAAAATVGERITPLKLVRPYCLSGLTACQGLLCIRACCLSGLVVYQSLLLVRPWCVSGLVACQGLLRITGLLQALGLLAHTYSVSQQTANCNSGALLGVHLGEDSGYAKGGMVVYSTIIQYIAIAEDVAVR